MTIRATSCAIEAVLARKLLHRPHRRLRGHMAGKHLEPDVQALPSRAESVDEQSRIATAGVNVEIAEFAFEDDVRPLETAAGEISRGHATLRGAAHMQPLHHAAIAGFGEGKQSRAKRAADADRHRGLPCASCPMIRLAAIADPNTPVKPGA